MTMQSAKCFIFVSMCIIFGHCVTSLHHSSVNVAAAAGLDKDNDDAVKSVSHHHLSTEATSSTENIGDDNDDGGSSDANTTRPPSPPLVAQVTLYVGLVAFSIIIITLCFVASLATSSPSDPTRRYCRACCQRFLRLRDEPELPPEMTSSSSSHAVHIDEPPSYEQALFMVRADAVHNRPVLDETTIRCDGADLTAVASTRHLIPGTTSGDGGRGSVTSSVSNVSAESTPVDNNVIDCSPPNYFEAVSGGHVTTPPPTYSELQRRILARLGCRKPPTPPTQSVDDVTITSLPAAETSSENSVVVSPLTLPPSVL